MEPHNKDSLFDIRSSFKSILSLLIGVAIDKGYIESIDDKLIKYFCKTEYNVLFTGKKNDIRIRDLLSMKSGLICEEFFSSNDCETAMEESQNWIKFCIEQPLVGTPGSKWSYNTCNAMIAGALIECATSRSLADFASKHFFEPLNITDYRWTQDPSGNYMSGGSFFMKGKDMLKIGHLILQNGHFSAKQIVSKGYTDIATSCITKIPSFSFVNLSGLKSLKTRQAYYGFAWYTEDVKVGKRTFTCQFTSGNGGQYILVVKELELVVVCTQGNFDSRIAKQFFAILIKHIIPNSLH
ncbi:beta-lactamase family protein [Sphingobacterium hotanense]|nr:beta-lactamase family protein [Sphingobacterium hotanense]